LKFKTFCYEDERYDDLIKLEYKYIKLFRNYLMNTLYSSFKYSELSKSYFKYQDSTEKEKEKTEQYFKTKNLDITSTYATIKIKFIQYEDIKSNYREEVMKILTNKCLGKEKSFWHEHVMDIKDKKEKKTTKIRHYKNNIIVDYSFENKTNNFDDLELKE
jgi:hypothetical protein